MLKSRCCLHCCTTFSQPRCIRCSASGQLPATQWLPPASPLPPCSWSALAQAVLVGTTMRHARHVCGASSLSSPAVHAAVRRVYRGMQVAACLTPLPVWAVLPDPLPEDQCTALVAFFQLAIGLLLPVMWQALTEARFFQLHLRERQAAGLSPERGPEAAVYRFVWQATMEGMGLQAAMLAWILLSTCWDQLSFLVRSTPAAAGP